MARPNLMPPPREMLEQLRNSTILIVGAAGSIGSVLALRLAALAPAKLILLDSSESNLYTLRRQWAREQPAVPAVFQLGNVSDRALLQQIFTEHLPKLVFHAAAFKHVPLLEEQPLAAIENNIFGTLALTESATGARVILLSTDKAVEPASVMGASKHVAEQIVLSAGGTALRLGNVLGTRGSVVEVFASQIAAGGPITITEPTASRYFFTVDEAVNLLLSAVFEPESPALLAPALPSPHQISELAHFMARELAPGRTIPITYIGRRSGDKESEQFCSPIEVGKPAKDKNLISIDSPTVVYGKLRSALAQLRTALDSRNVTAALGQLLALVPDYAPSADLLSEAGKTGTGINA